MTATGAVTVALRVRVADLNYGNHVGYHCHFLYFQEARIAYLARLGYSEMDIDGVGMIVAGAECRYKRELLLGDRIQVTCRVSEIKGRRFRMEYAILKDGRVCATGATDNLCFDYPTQRMVSLPEPFIAAVKNFEGME